MSPDPFQFIKGKILALSARVDALDGGSSAPSTERRFALLPQDFHDNSILSARTRDGQHWRTDPFSRAVFDTAATAMTLELYSDSQDGQRQIGIVINGVYTATVTAAAGTSEQTVNLPAGRKTVEIVTGFTHLGRDVAFDGTTPIVYGTFLTAVRVRGETRLVPPRLTARRLVFVGDSILTGHGIPNPPRDAWPVRLRSRYPGSVVIHTHSGRALLDDARDAGVGALARRVAESRPSEVYVQVGTNDAYYRAPPADFQAAYAGLLDNLHTLAPLARIWVQTMTVRQDQDTPNPGGYVLADYRAAIVTAAQGRSYVTVLDGTQILTLGDLSDGVHGSDAAQPKYAAWVATQLGLPA